MEVGLRPQRRGRLHSSDLGTGTSAEIEEERRLLYVAMTAQGTICIYWYHNVSSRTAKNAKGDRHLYASRTRFIPDGLLGLFDMTSCRVLRPASSANGSSSRAHECRRPYARDVAMNGNA